MNATTQSFSKPATLAEAAQQFNPVIKPAELLAKHKDAVLLLRARGASYPTIARLLASYGVTVGDITIGRFCRQHDAEIKRLMIVHEHAGQDVQQKKSHPVIGDQMRLSQLQSNQIALSNNRHHTEVAPTPNKMRSLRGKGVAVLPQSKVDRLLLKHGESKGSVPRLQKAWHALCEIGDKIRMPAQCPRVVRRGAPGGHFQFKVRSLPRGLEREIFGRARSQDSEGTEFRHRPGESICSLNSRSDGIPTANC